MPDRVKQNQEVRKAIAHAIELAKAHAQEAEVADPAEMLGLNLAAEAVDLRIAWLKNQTEGAKGAKTVKITEAHRIDQPRS
jgi:hypothetical protein